jgi:hypothetical protein
VSSAEYVSVFVSIVLGLGLVDILVSLQKLLRAGKRVKWDWAAPLTAAITVMLLIMVWWSQYPGEATMQHKVTIGDFLPVFVALVLMFLLASASLPDEVPPEGIDLKEYYDRNGPFYWGLFTAALGWTLVTEVWVKLAAGQDPVRVFEARLYDILVLALFASLIFIRKRWWHAIALAVVSLGPIGWLHRTLG